MLRINIEAAVKYLLAESDKVEEFYVKIRTEDLKTILARTGESVRAQPYILALLLQAYRLEQKLMGDNNAPDRIFYHD